MKKQNAPGHDTDKALAKPGTVNPSKDEKTHTEKPFFEKGEVTQAEGEKPNRQQRDA